MDSSSARRLAPLLYGAAVALCALFARDALVPVCVVGAIALGLMYTFLPRPVGRDRQRSRRAG